MFVPKCSDEKTETITFEYYEYGKLAGHYFASGERDIANKRQQQIKNGFGYREVKTEKRNPVELNSFRKKWEKKYLVVLEVPQDFRLLVVLKTQDGTYRCHRYFEIGEDGSKWEVSVDGVNLTDRQAMSWLLNPSANCPEFSQ